MSYYDASVVFYKLCMEKLTKGETFDKISTDEYWKKTSDTIHPARVRALLNQAIDVHDKILKNRGRFGRVHRCKNKPFRSKFISGQILIHLMNTLSDLLTFLSYQSILMQKFKFSICLQAIL